MSTATTIKIHPLILPEVGNTPLFLIRSLSTAKVTVWGKAEWQQPGSSIKARSARMIIKCAIANGKLHPGIKLLDAAGANSAIAYATLLKPLGWKPTIVIPASISDGHKKLLHHLGAEIIYTSPWHGINGARAKAQEMQLTHPEQYFFADQFSNDAAWLAHFNTTAPEIWNQTNGTITHFVSGFGSTATITGTGKRLKEFGNVKIIGLEPGNPSYPVDGWTTLGNLQIPQIFDQSVVDEIKKVDTAETSAFIKFIARHEGMYISPSAAASLQGALVVANELDEGVVVTTLSDTLDRYQEIRKQIFPANAYLNTTT